MKFSVVSFRCLVVSALFVNALCAEDALPLSKDYWKDEAFLKSFNGSYRINAQIEPTVSTEERGLLVSIQSFMAGGKRKEALDKLKASPLIKTSPAVMYNAGNIEFELGNWKEAAGYYQSALKVFPSFRRAHRNLGFVYVRENDWDKAMESLSEAIRLGEQDAATYGQLAYGRMQKEQYASALQAFRLAQMTQPEGVDWKVGVANCLQHLERHNEALVLLDEVIKARPNEISYYLLQSSVQLAVDRIDDAIANLDMVRRMGKLDAENHLLLANLYLRSGSVRLAKPLLMAALAMEEKPPFASALNAFEFIAQMREWKLAHEFAAVLEKAYEGAEEKLKRKQRRLNALVNIESGTDPKSGVAVLQELIQQNPLDADALLLLGKYRTTEKRYEEAEMFFQQAQRVEGHEYNAGVELAKLYVATNRYDEALKQLDEVLKIRNTEIIQEYRSAVADLAESAK